MTVNKTTIILAFGTAFILAAAYLNYTGVISAVEGAAIWTASIAAMGWEYRTITQADIHDEVRD